MKMEWSGTGLEKFQKAVAALGDKEARTAYRAVLNARGSKLRKDAVRILPGQSGLAKGTITRALGNPIRASNANLRYILTTRGGKISYKYFAPVEQAGGVTAQPRGQPKFLSGAFTQGGPIGTRRLLPLGGHVFKPNGRMAGNASKWPGARGNAWGRGFSKLRSDVTIPEEMVTGKMADAAEKHAKLLEVDIDEKLKQITGNITK